MKNTNDSTEEAASVESHLHKGNTLSNQGEYESAILEYNKALERDPNHVEACYKWACQSRIGSIP